MKFKSAREKSGMSQQELAQALGVDQSTVCLWETGKTKPRAKLLPTIAKILGCSIDELLAPDVSVTKIVRLENEHRENEAKAN